MIQESTFESLLRQTTRHITTLTIKEYYKKKHS